MKPPTQSQLIPLISKRERLLRLSTLVSNVPATYWSFEDFAASASEDVEWRLREHSGYSNPPERLSKDQTLELLSSSTDRRVVIQEYINPDLSGVTVVTNEGIISECVEGPSSGLLRGGARGRRWSTSSRGAIRWATGSALTRLETMVSVRDELRRASFPMCQYIAEWIVDDRGSFFWVDIKEFSRPYLQDCFETVPIWFQFGNPNRTRRRTLASTSLDAAGLIQSDTTAGWLCVTGSPLSHLCVFAFEKGISLRVLETESVRHLSG